MFGLIGLALGIAYLLIAPPTYTAAVSILLDENLTRYADQEATTAASNMKTDANLLTEVEIIKSKRLVLWRSSTVSISTRTVFMNPPVSPGGWVKARMRAVINRLDFWSAKPSGDLVKESRRSRAADLLQDGLDVERVGRSLVIDASVNSHDPQLAGTIAKAYGDAYLSDQLDAIRCHAARDRVAARAARRSAREFPSRRFGSRAIPFRAWPDGSPRELMSDQQLADLNSQLILAQADAASATARYERYKAIVESGEENAVNNATISPKDGGSPVIDGLKSRYLTITKREQEIASRFGPDHPQAVDLRREQADVAHQIFQELSQLTSSYRNESEVARSREQSLRDSINNVAGKSSQSSGALVQLHDLEQKAAALKTLYETFLARYQEAAQQRSFPIAKARVISEASVPTTPSAPKRSMVLALSLVLGLMAGTGIAPSRSSASASSAPPTTSATSLG